jgi:hypothetical protein
MLARARKAGDRGVFLAQNARVIRIAPALWLAPVLRHATTLPEPSCAARPSTRRTEGILHSLGIDEQGAAGDRATVATRATAAAFERWALDCKREAEGMWQVVRRGAPPLHWGRCLRV